MPDFKKTVQTVTSALNNNRFNIILGRRQIGLSTAIIDYAVDKAICNSHKTIVLLSTPTQRQGTLMEKINAMPYGEVKKTFTSVNDRLLELKNGSIIKVVSNEASLRGLSVDTAIFDGCAQRNDLQDIIASLMPCLAPKNGSLALCSTVEYGKWRSSTHFDEIWHESYRGHNVYKPTEIS